MFNTPLASISHILIPRFGNELYEAPDQVAAEVGRAVELARWMGAQAVSLTGLIPSATDYGRRIATSVPGLPVITTGHEATVAAVVLAIEHILAIAQRDLRSETVGFLGLGSVGTGVLRLMLSVLPAPCKILLCDLYSRSAELESLRDELINDLKFTGEIDVLRSSQNVSEEFYQSSLIVGATIVPDVLQVNKLEPGTLIVDDSAPHCFDVDEAFKRLTESNDILFCEGGILRSPAPIEELRYLPANKNNGKNPFALIVDLHPGEREIMGCILASAMVAKYPELAPGLGPAQATASYAYYEKLKSLGFTAADLNCQGGFLAAEAIERFRSKWGGPLRAGTDANSA
jgi:hypothetical protein